MQSDLSTRLNLYFWLPARCCNDNTKQAHPTPSHLPIPPPPPPLHSTHIIRRQSPIFTFYFQVLQYVMLLLSLCFSEDSLTLPFIPLSMSSHSSASLLTPPPPPLSPSLSPSALVAWCISLNPQSPLLHLSQFPFLISSPFMWTHSCLTRC